MKNSYKYLTNYCMKNYSHIVLSCRVRPCRGSDPAVTNNNINHNNNRWLQRGQSSAYVIIFVIVIIFAVMLSGGTSSLFTGNEPSSVIDTPTPTVPANTTPTASPLTSWKLSFSESNCIKEKIPVYTGKITATGESNGYISLEIQNGNSYNQIMTSAFKATETQYNATLSNSDNFDTKPWRIVLHSGGNQINNNWSGGEEKDVYNGNATGCN
jgi:hypothetical protein